MRQTVPGIGFELQHRLICHDSCVALEDTLHCLAAIGLLQRAVDICVTGLRARKQHRENFQAYLPQRVARLLGMTDTEDPQIATTSGREVPDGYKVLTEGKGSILQKGNDVFYNPAQVNTANNTF